MVGDLLWKIWLTRKIRSKTKYYIHTSEQRRFLIRWPSGNPVGCLLAASTSTLMYFAELLSNLVYYRHFVSKIYLFCHVKFRNKTHEDSSFIQHCVMATQRNTKIRFHHTFSGEKWSIKVKLAVANEWDNAGNSLTQMISWLAAASETEWRIPAHWGATGMLHFQQLFKK